MEFELVIWVEFQPYKIGSMATFLDFSVYFKNYARICSQTHFKIKLKLFSIDFNVLTSPKMFLQ